MLKFKSRQLVIALGLVALAAPAVADGQRPLPGVATVTAVDTGDDEHMWDPTDATIAIGGTVTFRYPSGSSAHNVAFLGPQPSGCTQTGRTSAETAPPLPATPSPAGWEGTCRFDTAGSYAFVCEAHPGMRGTIHVGDSAAATETPTPTPGAAATPGPDTATPLKDAVTLARSQNGVRVRGSVEVGHAGSRLEIAVSAPRHALSGGAGAKPVRVGRLTRSSTPAGAVAFAVPIDATARRALRRRHRLPVTVTIALTPPGGNTLAYSARSTLRADHENGHRAHGS